MRVLLPKIWIAAGSRLLTIALFSTSLFAGSAHAKGEVEKLDTTVVAVQAGQDGARGVVYVQLASGHDGVPGCSSAAYAIILFDPVTHPGGQQLLQVALAALLSGRKVDAYLFNSGGTNPTCPTGGIGKSTFPELRFLTIK